MAHFESAPGSLIGDLGGMGKVAESLLDAFRAAVGTLYRPRAILNEAKATADAEAYRIVRIAEAQAKSKMLTGSGGPAGVAELPTSGSDVDDDSAALRARSGARLVTVETRRQVNLERVFGESLLLGRAFEEAGGSDRAIDDDWMSAFIELAQNVSQEGVRRIWARVLASQAVEGQPIISRATLDALRLLEPAGAKLFERVARLFLISGQVMTVQDEPQLAFDIDSLEAMNLIDIGFLRRSDTRETTLDLNGGVLLFLDPERWAESSTPLAERLRTLGMRKLGYEIRVDRCLLTSRGFELAAILLPGFLGMLSGRERVDLKALGLRGRGITERILKEWAKAFSGRGAEIVFAELDWKSIADEEGHQGRAASLSPSKLWNAQTGKWAKVRG